MGHVEYVVFQDVLLSRTREWVLQDPRMENHAFIICGAYRNKAGNTVLLTRELLPTVRKDLEEGLSDMEVIPKREYVIRVLEYCRKNSLSLIDVHSHPWQSDPCFSGTDCSFGQKDASWVEKKIKEGKFPEIEWSMMVVGSSTFKVHTWDRKANCFHKVTDVRSIESPLKSIPGVSSQKMFDRQLRMWSSTGQSRIGAATVAIIGLGGLGSIVAEHLVRLGVTKLMLFDADRVEETNLNRLAGAFKSSVGKLKVDSVAKHLRRIAPALEIKKCPQMVTPKNIGLAKECDLVIGCSDNDFTRKTINSFSVRFLKPYFDLGSGIHVDGEKVTSMGGQVRLVLPGVTPCLQCIKDAIDPFEATMAGISEEERESRRSMGYVEGLGTSPEPAVIPLNGIIASIATCEISKFLTAFAKPFASVHVNVLEGKYKTISIQDREYKPVFICPTCGIGGILALGDVPDLQILTEGEVNQLAELLGEKKPERRGLTSFDKYLQAAKNGKQTQTKVKEERRETKDGEND